MLTGKQKRYLRSLAVNEKAIFQVGKDGLSENLYKSVNEALKARELVKISILKTCETSLDEIKTILPSSTNSELVQVIGKTIVLYKQSKDRIIDLPWTSMM